MWPFLVVLLVVAGVALHFWWRRRWDALHAELQRGKEALEEARIDRQRLVERDAARLEALFNSMVEGVILLDVDGRIQLVNRTATELFRLQSDVRGQKLLEACRHHELADIVQRVKADGQLLDHELELPGLARRCLEVNATAVLDSQKHLQGVILVFHDLTRLKELEGTRQEFVANVSHELRTPLSLIKGYVETLLSGAKDDPSVATRFLETVHKHAERLAFLIEDLLTISQLESGRALLNLDTVEINEVAQRVLEDLQSPAAARPVQLQNRIPIGLLVQADPTRLQQVFYNLVDNGIKYGRSEGCVELGARQREDGHVIAWVRDDGPGIPPEALERVFERFYRVDRARSREQGGTGLGLSIVKHIIHAHGGQVWAESETGKGAAFFFTLAPARREPNENGGADQAPETIADAVIDSGDSSPPLRK